MNDLTEQELNQLKTFINNYDFCGHYGINNDVFMQKIDRIIEYKNKQNNCRHKREHEALQ